jgi:hypothetical protein
VRGVRGLHRETNKIARGSIVARFFCTMNKIVLRPSANRRWPEPACSSVRI